MNTDRICHVLGACNHRIANYNSFGGMPFPSFHDFISSPLFQNHPYFYGMIILYSVALVVTVPRLILGSVNRDHLLFFAMVVFGVLLYRINLGRSHIQNAHKVAHPAFLLICISVDRAAAVLKEKRQKGVDRQWGQN